MARTGTESDSYGAPVNILGTRRLPQAGWPVGYAALINQLHLQIPLPPHLAMASESERPVQANGWLIIRASRKPANTLAGHLDFALRREGVDLSVLNALFKATLPEAIAEIVKSAPTGAHSRRLWFLFEWLSGTRLDVPDPGKVRAVAVVDTKLQFGAHAGVPSPRHRVANNLPGTRDFCPLVRVTPELQRMIHKKLAKRATTVIGRTHPDIMARAAAFMLLSDSKSSFAIEGERPPRERLARWGQAIAQAGARKLSVDEFERLQRVLVDGRFVELGLRTEGGFVGDHDRETGEPLPEHISAKAADLRSLIEGIVTLDERSDSRSDPVILAAVAAFGFVYIHPFEDGNGRLHRWLIHHVLAAKGFSPPGVVFPVSAAILRTLPAYKRVLESYSAELLPFIEWRPTSKGNVEVLNQTADFYRYFDATAHAEFLYQCVEQTVEADLPNEVAWLEAYDRFAGSVQRMIDMPSSTIALLHGFLTQNDGKLSKRAREKEFAKLADDEVAEIEQLFKDCHTAPSAGTKR